MKTILIFSVFLYLLVNSIFAQKTNEIIYHDFVPDTSFKYVCGNYEEGSSAFYCEEPVRFDIDADGIQDLLYTADGASQIGTSLQSLSENIEVVRLYSNDTLISDELSWSSVASGGSVPQGYDGAYEYRYGIRKVIGENSLFGYVKTRVEFNDTIVAMGYHVSDMICYIEYFAFCLIPNYPLLWGQTEISNSVPKTDAGNDGVKINFSNAANTVQIESLTKIKNVEIVSSNGQISGKSKNVNKTITEINASGLQSGVYIVKVVLEDGRVVSGKVVK